MRAGRIAGDRSETRAAIRGLTPPARRAVRENSVVAAVRSLTTSATMPGMSQNRREWRGPITLFLESRRIRKFSAAIAAFFALYVASSGPARSVLIWDSLQGPTRRANGSLHWDVRRTNVWRQAYWPLQSRHLGPARTALEQYWAVFPVGRVPLMTSRGKPGGAFWATVAIALLPILYVASFGPVCWLAATAKMPVPLGRGMYY